MIILEQILWSITHAGQQMTNYVCLFEGEHNSIFVVQHVNALELYELLQPGMLYNLNDYSSLSMLYNLNVYYSLSILLNYMVIQ
jgi:hypothetical protein